MVSFGAGAVDMLAYFHKYPIMTSLEGFLSLGKHNDSKHLQTITNVVAKDPLKL